MTTKAQMFANANRPGKRAYDSATETNYEGHPAWKRPLEERVVQLLSTNTLDNSFYATAEEIAKESGTVYREITEKDPEFFSKAIVWARNNGCMRLQPLIGLVFLSQAEDKYHFHKAFDKTVRTPHDLQTFLEYCKRGGIRGGTSRTTLRAMRRWLNQMGEYQSLKYPLTGKAFSLRDILRLAHPKPSTPKQSAMFQWIVHGEHGIKVDGDFDLPQIRAHEMLKSEKDPTKQRELIEVGRLPHEVVTPHITNDPETWTYVMKQMPHFALLCNLNTLERHGVLKDPASVAHVVSQLGNKDAVLKSKVLPFQYYNAMDAYAKTPGHNQKVKDAIVSALEHSFVNMPEIPGSVVVAPDVSGSMRNHVPADRNGRGYDEISSILSAALLKKSPDCTVLPFGFGVFPTDVSRHDSILSISQKFRARNTGTDLGAPLQYVRENDIPMDCFIGVSDNESWSTQHNDRTRFRHWGYQKASMGFAGEWVERKNKNAQAFLIRIDPYNHADSPPDDSTVNFIYGWSASVLDFVSLKMQGAGTQAEEIRKMEI